MSGKLKSVVLRSFAALFIVSALGVFLLLPPAALPLVDDGWTPERPIVRGAYHIHTQRSDGSGTPDEIAAEAAAEKLDFIILTDHGDATRTPDPPAYRSGVLVIDGVEISTSGGHYVALGMGAAPYPLGGPPAAVVEDVARLGGFGIAAHPDSAKPELRWSHWDTAFDGVEWLNADSEWRDETSAGLARLLATYWLRPVETLASALDRPVTTIERWDALTARRRVPVLAGADAHARIGGDRGDPYTERAVVHMPSYGVSFRTFQNHVLLDAPLSKDAASDAARLLAAIRDGHMFSTLDGLALSGPFELVARSGSTTARTGDYLDVQGPVRIEGRVAMPADATVIVLRDGVPVSLSKESRFGVDVGTQPGSYRVEVRLAGHPPVPWLFSNPIYVGLRQRHRTAAATVVPMVATSLQSLDVGSAHIESDPLSTSTLRAGESGVPPAWAFRLSDGARASQFAALRVAVSQVAAADSVVLRVSADRPMRGWVQLHAPVAFSDAGERWGASFYADGTEREAVLRFAEFSPFGVTSTPHPSLDRVDAILLVADTINTQPGAVNTLRVHALSLGRTNESR